MVKLKSFTKIARLKACLLDEDVAMIERACTKVRDYPAKHDLIREGDAPGPLYFFLEGWGCRYKILPEGDRQLLAFLLPGDFCDMHTNVLDEMDHSIATITPSLVASIDRTRMDELMENSPTIARAVWLMQLVDLGVARSWIASMGRRTSEERVAHLMCELFFRTKLSGIIQNDECVLPISQILLADALGLTPVHLNRVLRKFKDLGVMHLAGGRLIISDIHQLIQIAGFDETYLHRRLGLSEA